MDFPIVFTRNVTVSLFWLCSSRWIICNIDELSEMIWFGDSENSLRNTLKMNGYLISFVSFLISAWNNQLARMESQIFNRNTVVLDWGKKMEPKFEILWWKIFVISHFSWSANKKLYELKISHVKTEHLIWYLKRFRMSCKTFVFFDLLHPVYLQNENKNKIKFRSKINGISFFEQIKLKLFALNRSR